MGRLYTQRTYQFFNNINFLALGHRYVDHLHISMVALVFAIVTSNPKIYWYTSMLASFVIEIFGVFSPVGWVNLEWEWNCAIHNICMHL